MSGGIAALFVVRNAPYFGIKSVTPWDESKDARTYMCPNPVIAHPPCERWGRYWSGGPSAKEKRKLGDDNGCFESALQSVRKYTGVLEHPEASHAFKHFNLPIPNYHGGWTEPDQYGGRSCCVPQGNYGHKARKLTWLYTIIKDYPELNWKHPKGLDLMDLGYHSKEERRRYQRTGKCQRLSKKQRLLTPEPFRDLLISLLQR